VSDRTEQQREAVAERDRDVFLRAGAGTGKTTVLVDRFCSAAIEEEVGVENILAFTFTERAADQLRRRIRDQLSRGAAAADGDQRERLAALVDATDRAWISTIHGFCRRLLASHPAAAGLDPRFRVVDQPEADRLASRAFDDALEQLVEAGGAEALAFAAANRRFTLLQMTRGAYDELRSHGYPDPALPEPPEVDSAAALGELVAVAREAHDECADAKRENELESRERIEAAAALDPDAEPGEDLLERLRALEITSGGKLFKGEACERYAAALKRARAAVAAVVLRPAYEHLRELVSRFGRRYEALKAERSALDFEDLQLRAVALLRSSERIRDRYREQFRHLMVDEFQDTNELQLSLIEALRGPETRLFVVGDEFQSIYGFRHADVDVYRAVHRRFTEGREPNGVALPLTGNFRAHPEVLAATNALCAGLLDGFEPLSAADAAGSPPDEPLVELLFTIEDRKGWEAEETGLPRLDDDPSPAPKVAEARRLAARLGELVDAGEDPAEIVVLMRAFTHVATVERALDEAGLDPYVVGGRGFWSQQPIEDMCALLAVIANPLDDESLFGALASPACAVLPDTLWLLRRAATVKLEDGRERPQHVWPLIRDLVERGEPSEGDQEAAALIRDDELERLRSFATTLTDLRRRGAEGGLETLIDRAATAFDYDLATLMRDHGRERWANVRKLMRLAREFEAREGPDLGGFLEYLDARSAGQDRESEAATRAEGHAGVRVMTVHAAKGLEFGVVAVADLGRPLRLGWTPLRVSPSGDEPDESARVGVQLGRLGRPSERLGNYEELADLAAEREAEEEARLAYVAATRAKRRLILSGTFSPNRLDDEPIRRKPITLQLIRTVLGGDVTPREVEVPAAGDGFPSGRLRLEVQEPGPGVGAAILSARERERAFAEPSGTEPPLGRPDVPPALIGGLSYSALSAFENCGFRFYVERVLGVGEPEAAGGDDGDDSSATPEVRRRFGPGIAVHALLEWSARHRWREPTAVRAADALRVQGLEGTKEQTEAALELTRAFLTSPLREEIGAARVSAEVPFVLEIGSTLVRGSIDLLVEHPDGSVLVIDYKTDRLESREPDEIVSRYAVQRDLYALAAAARGAPVETAYVFLERPDPPLRESFGDAELDAARARVEALLERLAAGRFEVTDRPHRALCHDCPARERLCSYPIELTMRESSEAVPA
jgi:ATP-dependent helicase/nuclease subunit A